jgi:hypothetical protein
MRIIRAKTGEWVDGDEDVLLHPGIQYGLLKIRLPKIWDVLMMDLLVVVNSAARLGLRSCNLAVRNEDTRYYLM